MTRTDAKQPDLRAAIAKAGLPNPSALLLKKPISKKKGKKTKPEHECPREVACLQEREKLETDLKETRRTKDISDRQLKETQSELTSVRLRNGRDQKRVEEANSIYAALRRLIGAGKDAKASSLPDRIGGLISRAQEIESMFASLGKTLGLEAESLVSALPERVADLTTRVGELQAQAEGGHERESHLRKELNELRREQQARVEELETLKDLTDTTILIGGAALPGHIRSTIEIGVRQTEGEDASSEAETEEIVPTFFSHVNSSESLEDTKSRYASWVLGIGPYARSRSNRIRQGVAKVWTIHDLLASPPVNLEGCDGALVSIRNTEDGWVLRFIHADSRFAGTSWWNLVRIVPGLEGTRIEHALIRMTGAAARRPGTSVAIPNILKDLFQTAQTPYPWEDFRGKVKQIRAENAELFVEGILLNPARDVPVVVVSRTVKSNIFSLPPEDLAQALLGIAVVFETEEHNPYLLSGALRTCGIDPRLLSCFDGGVRVYLPGFSARTDPYRHPLWTRASIETRGLTESLRNIARRVAAFSVGLRTPPGFARQIEEHDLKVITENASRLAVSGQASEHVEALQRKVQALQERLNQTRVEAQQVPTLRMRIEELEDRIRYMSGIEQLVLQENDSLKKEQDNLARKVHRLSVQIQTADSLREEQANAVTPEILDDVLSGTWSPVGTYLRLLQARYPNRMVLLPKGLSSADECTFEPPDKPKQMLFRLVTDYYEALANGTSGDVMGAKCFGKDGYASHEGDNLSSDGVRARTFTYEGENVLMTAHLKITRAFERNTSNQVFRTYFYWDSKRKLIVIGHVGNHLVL